MSHRGRVVVWSERVTVDGASVTLARFDQRLTRLVFHPGTVDPGGSGWRHGIVVGSAERRRLIAAFNGGFIGVTGGGFELAGRLAGPLQPEAASVVTYRDGTTDLGAWRREVPAAGRPIELVLQNLHLLVDRGRPSPKAATCGPGCWGATLGGGSVVPRSALGITHGGQLVWAAGEHLTVVALARALVGAGADRALELDINPSSVGGYLYQHYDVSARVVPQPLVPDQQPPLKRYLHRSRRDFFTILARG